MNISTRLYSYIYIYIKHFRGKAVNSKVHRDRVIIFQVFD